MAEMVLIWIFAPALLLLLSYGSGLLLSVVLRKPMEFTLALLLGFLLIIILGSILTISSATAPFAALSIGLLGTLGLIISALWFRSYFRVDFISGLVGLITYVAFGLPVLAYGAPSWAGWVKLDDPATFFTITDRLMTVGRSVPSAINSTYDRVLQVIFDAPGSGHFSYPIGSFIPFGAIAKLTRIEKAWLWQPYLSLCAGLIAMVFVLILRTHIVNKVILVLVSTVSVMASTIYSYVMWGGIKEIVIIIPLALFAFTFYCALARHASKEWYLYSFISALGLYLVGGLAIIGFVGPILFVALLVKLSAQNKKLFVAILGLSGIAIVIATYFLRNGNGPLGHFLVQTIGDTGNLSRPLNFAQMMGIWPSQDFRMNPTYPLLTYSLIGIALVFTVSGVFYSFKRGLWAVPSLLVCAIAVVGNSYFWGGIWLTGKAIAVASPFFLLAAGIGAHAVWVEFYKSPKNSFRQWKLHYLLALLIAIVGSGVLVSDAMTYKNVWLAPFSQQDELLTIGKLYAGQGPTLMTEFSVFGARYFLRNMGAESASELRVHVIPTRDGTQLPKGYAADIDLFDNPTIDYFKLLVLRKAPNASRPPLNYELIWSGRYYEVWKRMATNMIIEKTMPLGSIFYPGAVPGCKEVTTFLAHRTAGDKVFAATRAKVFVVDFSNGDLPVTWLPTPTHTGGVDRAGSGGFSRAFSVDETRNYDFWIAGSFPGRLKLQLDDEEVFSGNSVFEGNPFLTNHLTRVRLSAGSHVLTLIYATPALLPGGDGNSRFGPIYISSQTAGAVKVTEIPDSKVARLCTQNLDWIAIARNS
jgi:hypothetical protein